MILPDLAKQVLDAAIKQRVMITSAESCTGGMIAAALTDVAGSSAAFERGFVTYSNAAKTELLDVPADLITQHGAVSSAVASAMAHGALCNSDADIAIATTGIAGPGGSEHKPEGRVCFAIARSKSIQIETVDFGAIGRAQVRLAATQHALEYLLNRLQD